MLQHHQVIHDMKMSALRAEAERERRWRLAGEENGRPARRSGRGPVRVVAARLAATVARVAAGAARRLDERVAADLGPERALRDS